MSEDDAGPAAAQQQRQPNASVPPSATFTIQPPEPFNFSKPQECEKWIRRFERFRLASNLHVSSQANQAPFGIASAPEHFQRRMSMVIEGLPGVVCHMDDMLIWERGVRPDPDKTRAVLQMKEPDTVSEVRSFLGMVNQLGKFIPCFAEKDRPLRDLLSKRNHWGWGEAQQEAFSELKRELSSTPVLALYNPNKELKLSADASSYGLGAVLLQKEEEQWKPVAYASRSLTHTEQRYAQVEKEALGLTWGCEMFKDFLIGHHFHLETDHKPLVSLLNIQELAELPPRIQRFRMRLMRFQ
ncbi:Transposon Ty3-G Gag-Pol poly [Labeo rohita]|uniref:Transposon Ty3-G Gag-Pol poly n=1 Tax=Labeo rohita TaxID=84645 RepID=A0A498ME73_LABRO|nr:Transposon Ty3-G Gag-Pol poly [Labeo rohita]